MKGQLLKKLLLIFALIFIKNCTVNKMHSKKDALENWPIPIENHFSDTCMSPKNGEATLLVDTSGFVRKVIYYKCNPGDSNYFYTNLLKLKFQPCVFSGKPVSFRMYLKLKYCNLTKKENDGKPLMDAHEENKKEYPIKNIRIIKSNNN